MNTILIAAGAGLAGVVIGWLAACLRCGRSTGVLEAELAAERNGRLADRDAAEKFIDRMLAAKDKEFAEMLKTLEERFANLATVTLESRSKSLGEANKVSLEAALKPLSEQMTKFQEATQKAQNDNRDLGNSIHKDIEAIGKYAKDLSDFSVAIKSGNTVQGRKGEDILAEKLRQSGLEENVTFFLQSGTGSDRPDAQVCDAENRWLIIDSKVSMTAFVDYRNPDLDDETRKARLKAHVDSVRDRVKSLRDKEYPKVFAREFPDRNYLPVAAMFVPYEAALTAALEAEPSLWQYALEGNVVFVTPMTLIAYLRLVQLAWQHTEVEKKYVEVIKDANELLTRMNNFVLEFQAVGEALAAAKKAYDSADMVIVDGPHRQTIGNSMRKLLKAGSELQNSNPMASGIMDV